MTVAGIPLWFQVSQGILRKLYPQQTIRWSRSDNAMDKSEESVRFHSNTLHCIKQVQEIIFWVVWYPFGFLAICFHLCSASCSSVLWWCWFGMEYRYHASKTKHGLWVWCTVLYTVVGHHQGHATQKKPISCSRKPRCGCTSDVSSFACCFPKSWAAHVAVYMNPR